MNIGFKNNKIKKLCTKPTSVKKEYSIELSKKLYMRLDSLRAALTLSDIPPISPDRCHDLKGDLKGFFAVDLEGRYRLIIKPVDKNGNSWNLKKYNINYIKNNTVNIIICEISKHYE